MQEIIGIPGTHPIKAWVDGVEFEEEARQQVLRLASMPFINSHVAIMPDVHAGKGATVGSVIATIGAIIPAAVGVDIGCGMMAVETGLKASDLPDDLHELRTRIEARVPHGRTDNGGLSSDDTIVDVGAGRMDFSKYMRSIGWHGEYIPVDGGIDGTDLNMWEPKTKHPFFVAIEVVEHVHDPVRLMNVMMKMATKGVVCTTPNSERVDVIACDPTHVSVIPPKMWEDHGWKIARESLFMNPEDSVVAWKFLTQK